MASLGESSIKENAQTVQRGVFYGGEARIASKQYIVAVKQKE